MSTTLTNGLKLPDKGSVDWYADMQNNYTILDNSVGTVAEHTTQIAGKAPAVHTHTKSDITDFPAYGNTAGTICEGNDSRLSDARTPVAHTHTKSDVTDLLNSNFIPSSNGSYNLGSLANRWGIIYGIESNVRSDKIDFTDTTTTGTKAHWHLSNAEKNGSTFFQTGSQRNHSAGLNEEHFRIKNANDKWADLYIQLDDSNQFSIGTTTHSDVTNNGFKGKFTPFDSFIPYANNSYDLGSSGKQWNNLYAKNYYYNGVAWGLDQANVWTDINIFQGNLYHKSNISTLVKGTNPSSVTYYAAFRHQTYAGKEINLFRGHIGTSGDNCFRWTVEPWVSGSNGRFQMRVSSDGSVRAFEVDGTEVSPFTNNATDLGTSTNKWKTLNGINPGALSLPDMDSTVSKITELAAAIDKTQTANSWTADFTGILRITWYVKNLTGPFRCTVANNSDIRYATWGQTFSANDVWYFIISFPVQNGKTYYFDNSFARTAEDTAPIVYGASAVYCLGNV